MKFMIHYLILLAASNTFSYSSAWNHGDGLNAISIDNFINIKDIKKLSVDGALEDDVPKPKSCHKLAVCVPVKSNTCLGVKLPYTHTSLSLNGATNLDDNLEKLEKWRGLMHVPRCWTVIQSFLCSLYMPKCENGSVYLLSKEMCEITRHHCRILIHVGLWPEKLRCDSFESKCKNNVRELKFNTTGRCKFPLVPAIRESLYYESIEGCGVQCHNPYFSEEERRIFDIHSIVFVICFLQESVCCYDIYYRLAFFPEISYSSYFLHECVFLT